MSTTLSRPKAGQVTWANSRWSLLWTAAATRAANFSLISIIARYLSDQGLSAQVIGIVLAVAGFTTAASQALWARLLTRRGAAVTGVLAAVLGTAGCVVLGLATEPVTLVVADMLLSAGFTGLATAVRTVTASLVADQDDSERRFGQLNSYQTIGGFAGPLVLGWLVIGSSDAAPWFAAAIAASVLLVWLWLAWRSRNAWSVPATESSAEEPADVPSEGERAARPTSAWQLIWELRLVLICTVGTSFLYGANIVLWGLYLKGLGANASLTAWSFALFSVPMVILAPRAGRLWGNVPRTIAIPLGAAALGAMAVVYGLVTVLPLAVGLTLVEGSLMALAMPITAAQIPLVVPERDIPRGYAMFGALDTTFGVIGTAGGGALVGFTDVRSTWFVCGAVCIAAAVVAWLVGQRPAAAVQTSEDPA